ncbi:MAG: hypothetical protein R3175_14355 [Marinobacter sp.]|uniref:hypothetical protein n=1 Tax=Marinobacter sp. TaxID=50741 RepID=UPI00299D6758|nr:hypothetical protein [Marinobacter sp.]MDX1757235.1 hypothetical protein [Marinobacter sp.]
MLWCEGAVVPGVAQGNQAVEPGAVVALAFQFDQQGVGEGGLAAVHVVAGQIGVQLAQLLKALAEGGKKTFQGRYQGKARGGALEGERK